MFYTLWYGAHVFLKNTERTKNLLNVKKNGQEMVEFVAVKNPIIDN